MSSIYSLMILVLILLDRYINGIYDTIVQPESDVYNQGTKRYIMYTHMSVSFNEARAVCQQHGGDLAKINSQEALDDLVNWVSLTFPDTSVFFAHDYWIGVIRPTATAYFWVSDCSLVTYSLVLNEDYNSNEWCVLMKKAHDQVDRKPCGNNHKFLCEIIDPMGCSYHEVLTGTVSAQNLYNGHNGTACETECSTNTNCWGTIQMPYSPTCTLLVDNGLPSDVLKVTSKLCMQVEVNTSNPAPPITDNTNSPSYSCTVPVSATPVAPVVPVTPTSTFTTTVISSSEPVICPTVTVIPSPVYVTVDQTISNMEISTVYETVPVTVDNFVTVSITPSPVTVNNYVTTSVDNYVTVTTSVDNYVTTTVDNYVTIDNNITVDNYVTVTTSVDNYVTTTVDNYVTIDNNVTVDNYITVENTLTSCDNVVTVMPLPVTSVAMEVVESIAEEIVKNLTVDTKTTSSHLRTLVSAEDSRRSSQYIGTFSVLCVAIPLIVIVLADVAKIIRDFRHGPSF